MAQGAVAESPALHARWGNHRLEVDIDSSMWGVPDLDATDLGAQWSAKTCESHSETAPQRIQTLLIDDIDGGEAAGAVRFSLDGREYEIDLSATHSDELRKALEQYLAHARRAGTARTAARSRRGSASVDTAKVREWAKGQGIEVKDRGRVPAGVLEQYKTTAQV